MQQKKFRPAPLSVAAIIILVLGVAGLAVARGGQADEFLSRNLNPLTGSGAGQVTEIDTHETEVSVGTTPMEAVTDDIALANRKPAGNKSQLYTFHNKSSDKDLCAEDVAYSLDGGTGPDCDTTCAALGITCDDATDGGVLTRAAIYIPPGQARGPVAFDADRCVCIVGEDGGTAFHTERLFR